MQLMGFRPKASVFSHEVNKVVAPFADHKWTISVPRDCRDIGVHEGAQSGSSGIRGDGLKVIRGGRMVVGQWTPPA